MIPALCRDAWIDVRMISSTFGSQWRKFFASPGMSWASVIRWAESSRDESESGKSMSRACDTRNVAHGNRLKSSSTLHFSFLIWFLLYSARSERGALPSVWVMIRSFFHPLSTCAEVRKERSRSWAKQSGKQQQTKLDTAQFHAAAADGPDDDGEIKTRKHPHSRC